MHPFRPALTRADAVEEIGDGVVLALVGPRLSADDRQVLNAFAAQLTAARERARLGAQAATATALGQANELRAALLQAVSHDLRTPLASIKAAVSSLRQPDVEWSDEDVAQFLESIEDETDRLNALVGNLLDMSRLQAGVHRTAAAARPPRGGRARRAREPRRTGPDRRDGRVGVAPRRSLPTRRCSNASSPTSSRTR